MHRHSALRELWEWVRMLAVAVGVAALLTTFVFQIIGVDGISMMNTLQDGERMFVTKYQYILGDPERFDVVICNYPGRGDTKFVKRIVGVPGDVVAVRKGKLFVNGEMVEEAYIDYQPDYSMGEVLVGEGQYFVLGDNRSSSNDSHRDSVGQLSREHILGRVRAVVWPLSEMRIVE